MIRPIEIDELPAFHEVMEGDWKTYPADDRDLEIARSVAPIIYQFNEVEHALTDGEFIYYSVAVDIPPTRKTIGRPKTVRREVWVRGTFDNGRPATRWEPEEDAEPVNPDGDGCFRSLDDAVIYTVLEKKHRDLVETSFAAGLRWEGVNVA